MKDYKIAMSEPDLSDLEASNLARCLSDNWISSAGPFINEFEKRVAKYFNRRYAIATSSGTSAIELSLKAQGVSAGHGVLIPDWTFSGTINAVLHLGAEPVFCDIDPSSFGLCMYSVQRCFEEYSSTGKKIKAVLPVHPLGIPLCLRELYEFSSANGLAVVEDAAGAFGSRLNGRLVGSTGDAVIFSFNGNKVLTCGGGDMVLTDDPVISKRIMITLNML